MIFAAVGTKMASVGSISFRIRKTLCVAFCLVKNLQDPIYAPLVLSHIILSTILL